MAKGGVNAIPSYLTRIFPVSHLNRESFHSTLIFCSFFFRLELPDLGPKIRGYWEEGGCHPLSKNLPNIFLFMRMTFNLNNICYKAR